MFNAIKKMFHNCSFKQDLDKSQADIEVLKNALEIERASLKLSIAMQEDDKAHIKDCYNKISKLETQLIIKNKELEAFKSYKIPAEKKHNKKPKAQA